MLQKEKEKYSSLNLQSYIREIDICSTKINMLKCKIEFGEIEKYKLEHKLKNEMVHEMEKNKVIVNKSNQKIDLLNLNINDLKKE